MTCVISAPARVVVQKGMKKTLTTLVIFAAFMILTVSSSPAACNVCHSKNPKMQKMHEALGYKDCFKCHGMGQVKKNPDERNQQMSSDPLCVNCHKK